MLRFEIIYYFVSTPQHRHVVDQLICDINLNSVVVDPFHFVSGRPSSCNIFEDNFGQSVVVDLQHTSLFERLKNVLFEKFQNSFRTEALIFRPTFTSTRFFRFYSTPVVLYGSRIPRDFPVLLLKFLQYNSLNSSIHSELYGLSVSLLFVDFESSHCFTCTILAYNMLILIFWLFPCLLLHPVRWVKHILSIISCSLF